MVHNKDPSNVQIIYLPPKAVCFLKFSSYRKKKIIADHSLITPKCPFKMCQKTILQLLFKSSFFLFDTVCAVALFL